MATGSSSSSWTTHFTPEAGPVTLANTGDQLKVTWVFTPSGVNAATQNSLTFPFCIVDTPSGQRLAADASPATAAYTGYAIYSNMGTTLGGTATNQPFSLRERQNPSGALLSAAAEWGANGVASTNLASGGTIGNHGYDSGTQYTMVWKLTRNGANLDIDFTMSGGTLNGTGSVNILYTDTSPNGFSYDTFSMRPSLGSNTATGYDTTLFKVEVFVPEPATFVLMGLALPAMALVVRRRSSR